MARGKKIDCKYKVGGVIIRNGRKTIREIKKEAKEK